MEAERSRPGLPWPWVILVLKLRVKMSVSGRCETNPSGVLLEVSLCSRGAGAAAVVTELGVLWAGVASVARNWQDCRLAQSWGGAK